MEINQTEALRPFIDQFDLNARIGSLVKEIADDWQDNECIVVGILKKSFVFLADFIRQFHSQGISPAIDFITLTFEESTLSLSDNITVERDITLNIRNKWILLVDDVLDTGHTAEAIHAHLSKKEPKILKTCVLLDKLKKRETDFQPDYVGFTIPDVFVVGYGLGYNHRCRELPSISIAAFEEIDRSLMFSIKNNTVFLNGRLDANGVDHIRETLLHWKGNLQLDLTDLEYIGSAGLGLLLAVHKKMIASGHRAVLLNVKPAVRESIQLGGFGVLF